MLHISIPMENTVELLNFTPVNPLIDKCQIKVCYVGDNPNRNRSIITKEVAIEMAKSLPGSPIVGFYNEAKGDFEEHNRVIDISNGKFEIKDTTRAYGFVDMGAKVWFQKFLDDGVEHEYLMTEGYIWSDVYPEAKRIIDKGNNQSMELHEEKTKGSWTRDDNGLPEFFIINEAIIKKLCVLGEDVEPCFEGAGISAQFSLDVGDIKQTLFSMIEELQMALKEGGNAQMDEEIKEIQSAEEVIVQSVEEEQPTENFKKDEEEKEKPSEEKSESDQESSNDENEDEDEEKKKKDYKCNDEEKKKKYSLEEIPEYVELAKNYSQLQKDYDSLNAEIASLREFKVKTDRAAKQAMINSFYMLSDAEKQDCINNIDTYSIDDIEAKLSIICVRNKVSFALDDDNESNVNLTEPTVYTVDNSDDGDSAPAWIKAVRVTAQSLNN